MLIIMLDSEISTHNSSEDGISLEDKSSSQDKDSSLMSRKISVAFSETDSGVDVGGSEEESLDTGVEKKVIRPDLEIISRLCNFDEEASVKYIVQNAKNIHFSRKELNDVREDFKKV